MNNNQQLQARAFVQPERVRPPIQVGLLAALLVLIPSLLFVRVIVHNEQRDIAAKAEQLMDALVTKLEGRLQANLAVGIGFEAQIAVLGDLNQVGLNVLAERLIDPDLNIRHVALAPDLVVRAVYPLPGNEAAIGLDYRTHEKQGKAALQAMETNKMVLAGPLRLVQGGGSHLVARFPVYLAQDEPWGLIALVIRADELFADVGLIDAQFDYQLAMRGTDGRGESGAVFFGDPALFQQDVKTHKIQVPGGSWQMAIRPIDGWNAPLGVYLIYSIMALSFALLGGAAAYSLRRSVMMRLAHMRHLESLSAIDPLTRITSRYQFKRDLAQRVKECERDGCGFTLLFIDLDHFKEVNDGLGHARGDELLVTMADRMNSCMKRGDLLSRMGSDEFTAVFRGVTSTVDIEHRAEALMAAINQPVNIGGLDITITSSIGVAVYPEDGQDGETLIRHADRAKFESKRAGRNTLYFFNASMRNEADQYIELTSAMKAGLPRGEFEVYYQPIYDLRQGVYTRCEALMRWRRGGKDMVSPADFIPVAEQSGLIVELGAWLADEVFNCYQIMQGAGLPMKFSINRSAQEFSSLRHTQHFMALQERRGIPTEDITLEITESLLMSDNRTKSDNFQLLKEHGFLFSIDDFGTGYSAINYLRSYPAETLKIDRSFIWELGESEQADVLVRVIIQLAQALGIAVVAEGVETPQQLELLREMGCDYIQGFYLAKPMPQSEFKAFIRDALAAS